MAFGPTHFCFPRHLSRAPACAPKENKNRQEKTTTRLKTQPEIRGPHLETTAPDTKGFLFQLAV